MTTLTDDEIIAFAKCSGFKASCGRTDKEGTYHPNVNALGKAVPIEWLSAFAQAVLAAAEAKQSVEAVTLYPCGFAALLGLVVADGAYLASELLEGTKVTERMRDTAMVAVKRSVDMASLLATQPPFTNPPKADKSEWRPASQPPLESEGEVLVARHGAVQPTKVDDKQAGEVMKWTHGCNALCTNIELWIDHCPHCGKPREAAHLKKPEPQTPVQAGWQPIETAPKDGECYLASDGSTAWAENTPENYYPGEWTFDDNRMQWRGHAHSDGRAAKFWMPLPPPKGSI